MMEGRKRLYEVRYANDKCKFSKQCGYQLIDVGVWAEDAEDALFKLRDSGENVVHVERVANVVHPPRVIM